MEKPIVFIPIKLNNQRLPGKNIKYLGDKPLAFYQQNELLKIKDMFKKIVVFCSDDSIKDYLLPGIEFLRRPAWLDGFEIKCNDIIKEFMKENTSDWYVLDHVTAPYVKADTISDIVERVCFQKDTASDGFDSGFAARGIKNFLWMGNKPVNFDIQDVPRTQDLETVFVDKCGPYVFSRDGFIKTNRRIGMNPYIKELSFRESIDIDTPEDFEIAKRFLNE